MADASETRAQFLAVSTATLTTVLFKRGLRNTFIDGARPLNPRACRMAGPAFTLRYIPAREDIDTIEVFKDPRHPQRHAVETIPPGAVMVIDLRGDARAASAGCILITRMMVRGAAGIVTDGGLRDSTEIAEMPFPHSAAAPRRRPTSSTTTRSISTSRSAAAASPSIPATGRWATARAW